MWKLQTAATHQLIDLQIKMIQPSIASMPQMPEQIRLRRFKIRKKKLLL